MRALCVAASAAVLAVCVSSCGPERAVTDDLLDPAAIEAQIAARRQGEPAKTDLAMKTPEAQPSPKPEPAKEPAPPKPEPPKEPAPPKPEPPKEPAPPKPEPPKEPTPKPEPAKEPAPPKPEPPKEPAPPKPEPAKEPTPPKPEPPKEPAPPKPEPPKEPAPPKPEPPKPKPEPPKEPTPPKPEPPKPEPPKPEPPKEPQPKPPEEPKPATPLTLSLFCPQERHSFAQGETAELTLVIAPQADLPQAKVTLSATSEAQKAWTVTDDLGLLPAGRHSFTYGVATGCFPPGSYKLVARVGEQEAGAYELTVASAVPKTRFRLVGWTDRAPKSDMEALRWSRALGLNTVLLADRPASESAHPIADGFVLTSRQMRSDKGAKPIEADWSPPPFHQVADRLTKAGLQWISACAASGAESRLGAERDLADPQVVRGAHQRIHHRLLAERRFRNCAGIHFTDEAALPNHRAADYEGPFGVPAQLEAFKKRFDAKDVPWRQGAKWDGWEQFMMYRAGILGDSLASWSAAAQAFDPGLLITSQCGAPLDLASGIYPPLEAKGLPIACLPVSSTGPAGMMMSAIATDLQRAGNWSKAIWLMPELMDDADLDEARAAIFLAVGRKIEGVVYPRNLDYRLDRPNASALSTDLLAGVSSINHTLTRLGDFLLALERPRSDVAILYSVTEHIDRIGADPVKNPQAPAYPSTLLAAYEACCFVHFPPNFLTEEQLLSQEGAKSKLILVIGVSRMRPEVKARLEAHAASGGIVLADPTTKAEIVGAKPLGIEFPDLHKYCEEVRKKAESDKADPTPDLRDIAVQAKLIYPLLPQLETELKRYVNRDYRASDPDMITSDQRCGAGRYIFVVNNTQRPDVFRGLKWELAAAQSRITFREGSYAAYDLTTSSRIYPQKAKGHPTHPVVLAPGELRIFALLPEPVAGVSIHHANFGRNALDVAAFVHGRPSETLFSQLNPFGGPKPLDAAVPIELILTDPAGNERLHLYRVHKPDGYRETIPLAALEEPGTWTLLVRELLSRQSATATFRVRPGSVAWASRRGPLAIFDGDRIAALLRSSQPLAILVGTEQEAAKAEPLAAALRARSPQRTVEVKLAAPLAKPRALTKDDAARYVSAAPNNAPMPDVRENAILLGDVASHPLLQTLHNSGVLPRTPTPDYLGPGGALLCHVLSAFEPDTETIVAAAADEAGVTWAIQSLLAAVQGRAPATAWAPASPAIAAAEAKGAPHKPAELPLAWRQRGTDNPTCAAGSLQDQSFVVGFFDGLVSGYAPDGKLSWDRRCVTRTRALARSLDGATVAVASFPELLVLSEAGQPQFGAAIEDTSRRADHTAIATVATADAAITVAGTRRGVVFGYDIAGAKLFAVAEADADDKQEGWQSRFGTIGALAISPKTAVTVIGADTGLAAVDPKGQELWATKEVDRIACLAPSLGEEQTVALGSRAGYAACISGGTVLWRAETGGYVPSVSFRGTTQDVLAASLDGALTCYDKNGKVLWTHRSPTGFRFVGSSIDGETIAAAELAGRVILFNKSGKIIAQSRPFDGMARAFALTADGGTILVGTSAGDILVFRLKGARGTEDEL